MVRRYLIIAVLLAYGVQGAFCCSAVADDGPTGLGAIAAHDHKPIVVRSKPVIERLPVKVISPIDLVVSSQGVVFVADQKAECVFRLDRDGTVSLIVEQLADIQRILADRDGSVYVLTSTSGESAIHQITDTGRQAVLQTFNFPSSSFVRDETGNFVISVPGTGRLMTFSAEGEISQRANLSRQAVDIIWNAGGQLEALLPSGHLVLVGNDGQVSGSGFAAIGSMRFVSPGDGELLTLANTGAGRFQISRVERGGDRPDQFFCVATVPAGTRAVGFDSLGNICLANVDLRAVTRVTSNFEIACPHCGRPTRMIFTSDPEPAAGELSRSF